VADAGEAVLEQTKEVRVAKSKSEPRKTKPTPEKRAPAGEAGASPGPARTSPDPHPKRRPQAKAVAKTAAKKVMPAPDHKARPRLDMDASGDDEERSTDESDGDGDGERADPINDSDVVEVVGEVVDEPTLDEDDGGEIGHLPSTATGLSNEAALSRSDPLQAYLREVQRHALLTLDEEKELTQRYYKNQDVQTAARLVTANLRLVVKLAYEYRRAYKNIMDLIQEGNIGLMQAVKRYDPYRGVKLSSYAAWWIRAYILRFILNNWRLVKLGTTQAQRKLFFNLNKEKAKLSALGIEPSAAEIAQRLHVEEKEVVEMDRRLSSGEASLDAPVGDTDGRAVSRIEMMPSMAGGPDATLEAREIGELVHDRLSKFRETLKGKDVTIFDKRMAAEDPLTLQELGDEFGISRERVRQLEARLTMKLRVYLKDELGDAVGTG
jgi:RNA polymerase sigma-32 factor